MAGNVNVTGPGRPTAVEKVKVKRLCNCSVQSLTRRRDPDARECWLIYYGDVHVGTIA